MTLQLRWLGHASFFIHGNTGVVAIDPWKVSRAENTANLILISHSHFDHYSPDDIEILSGPETILCGPPDVRPDVPLRPWETRSFGDISVTGIPAYNSDKKFHPKSNNWLGFVVEIDGKRIYYAGDTDRIPEMSKVKDIDVALLPAGGTYTMDAVQAAAAADAIGCALAVPYHWGDIVGSIEDAERFKKLCKVPVRIVNPNDAFSI